MTEPLKRRFPWAGAIAVAALSGALFGGGMYAFTHSLAPNSGLLLLGFLFGVPIASCVLASLVLHRNGRTTSGSHVGLAAIVITCQLVGGAIFAGETAICLVMAAPIFYITGCATGAIMGAILKGPRDGRALGLVILAPLLILPVETQVSYPLHHGSVTTVVIIDAPPEEIWAHTVEIPAIEPGELPATFSHIVAGVPRPIDAVMSGSGVGAVRHLRWERGVRFEEHVTAWEENQRLAWTFHFARGSIPANVERHIRVDGDYLRLTDGDYRLEPLPGGRTRLTLTTHYWFRTPINAYCEYWAQQFIGDFHRGVLSVIETRAEAV